MGAGAGLVSESGSGLDSLGLGGEEGEEEDWWVSGTGGMIFRDPMRGTTTIIKIKVRIIMIKGPGTTTIGTWNIET